MLARTPWRLLLAVTTGVLLALCFPPWNFGGLVWVALTPLICALWIGNPEVPRSETIGASDGETGAKPKRRPNGRPFLLGYLAGLIFFTTTFHWIGALGTLFRAPALYGLPLLLAAYLALYPAAWAWFLSRVLASTAEARTFPTSLGNLATAALAASAWTALDWVRGWLLTGFGWNSLAVALHRDLPMIQIAEYTGVAGLNWLVVFVNVMAVIVVRRIIGELGPGFLKRVRWEFSTTMALIAIIFSFGIRQLLSASAKGPAPAKINLAVVQPNIPQAQKFNRAEEDKTREVLEHLTTMAAAMDPDLIVWPEASTERGIFSDRENYQQLEALRARVLKPILVGTVEDTLEDAEPRTFNSAMLLPAGPGRLQEQPPTYRKIHLVPFGEYLPLRFLLNPIAGRLVPGDIDVGREFTVFQAGTPTSFSTLICFEDTLPRLARRFTTNGANFLMNITNDGWFLRSAGLEQHLANAVLRAVENRRPLVRCANTGVTALVHPNGAIDRWLEPHREGFAARTVELHPTPLTFYTRHGDWFAWVSCALTALGFLRYRRTP